MRMQMAALALASVLTVPSAAWALEPGAMTVEKFRTLDHTRQVSMIFGAIAITDTLGVLCPVPVTVGEFVAALTTRQLDVQRPWAAALTDLMDERGCKVQVQKADT